MAEQPVKIEEGELLLGQGVKTEVPFTNQGQGQRMDKVHPMRRRANQEADPEGRLFENILQRSLSKQLGKYPLLHSGSDRSTYNPYRTPADLAQAEVHALEDLPLCCSTRDFEDIGSVYVQYFSAAAYVAYLLFSVFVVTYSKTSANFKTEACQTYDSLHECSDSFITKLSIANFGIDNDWESVAINIFLICSFYLFLAFVKNKMTNQHKVIDIETDTVSDFSIMVTYLPKTAREKDIKEFFETQFPGVQVAQVCLAYDVEALTAAKLTLASLQHQLAQALTSQATPDTLDPVKTALAQQELKIAALKQDIRADHTRHFTGVAFVTFEHIHMARRVTELYEMRTLRWVLNGFKYKLKYSDGSLLKVRWAPEAEEVIWENLNYSFASRMKKRALTVLVTLAVLGVSFGIIFGLKYLNYKAKKSFKGTPIETTRADGVKEKRYPALSSSQTTQLEVIAIAIWLTCKIVNKIFDGLLVKLTRMEKHHSYGDFDMSAVIKTVIAQFLNTSCLIVIVHVIVNSSELYYIWGAGGLIGDIWTILIGNSIVLPLLNLLNFGFIAKLFKRCKLKENKNNKVYTQKQAHEIMEGVAMDPIRSYTDIYQVLLTSCFFVSVFPANALFHFGTLVCIYWIQKVYLLRFYSRPRLLQHTLGLAALRFIKVAAFLISTGELVFDAILRPKVQLYFIIQTVVTAILIFVPIEDALLNFYSFSGEKAQIKKRQKYSEFNHKFASDYPRENPLTSEEATEAHILQLKGLLGAQQPEAQPQPLPAVASEQA